MYLRMRWSSTSSSEKSCLFAYQWLSQSVMMPTRNPVGLTFCPMYHPFSLGIRALSPLVVGQGDVNVRVAALDDVRRTARPRHDALHHRPAVDARLDNDQVVNVARPFVLGVAQGALEDVLQEARTLVGHEAQQLQRFVGG